MEYEIATELPRLELELAEVADSCIKGKMDIAKEVAKQAYEQLLTQAGEQISVVFELFTMAENGGKIHREKCDADELASRFFARLNIDVRRLDLSSTKDLVAQQLALPPIDLGDVDMTLANSVAARSMLSQKLNLAATE